MSKTVRVIIVEDSEDDVLLTLHHIKRAGFELEYEHVETAEQLKSALEQKSWDIVLSDFKMPHFNGLDALRLLKDTELDIPFIIISGTIGEEVAVQAMREGAHDYIMKDNLQRLVPAIERELRESKLREERIKLKKQQKKAEEDRLAHLRFFESMDKVNRAIQGKSNLESMMSDVLDVVQDIFKCDRAFLLYPCDPESPTWSVPMEKINPEYQGGSAIKVEAEMDAELANSFRTLLNFEGPVKFGPGSEHSLPKDISKRYNLKSFIGMALYPKAGKPWELGLHQCSYERDWSVEDVRLFQEIGRRISDALSTLLSYQSLSESEERYRLIAENTADVISVFDLNLNPAFISPSIKNMLGYTVDEYMKLSLDKILVPHSLKKVQEVLDQQLALENDKNADPDRSVLLELEEYHKDGHIIWVELVASLIRDKSMKAIGILTITRNVTKRKQAELKLIDGERKYRSLAESSPDSIMRYDTEGRLLYINRQMELNSGINFRSIVGKSSQTEKDNATLKDYYGKIKKVIETGEPEEIEVVIPNQVEEIRTHHVRFVAERNNEGKIVGVLAIGQDITERKHDEEQLRKLLHAVEQSPVSIVITDTQGTIEYVNPTFSNVTGYTMDEAIGQNPRILKSDKMSQKFYEELWNTILAGKVWRGEFQNCKKNGKLYYESASISPIFDNLGNITHFIALKEDITEHKGLEERYRQAQKMEAIGQLAGGVAHDFNNMLGVMLGYSELLIRKTDKSTMLKSDLQAIRQAALSSIDLTRQLLTFARKQTVIPQVVNLNDTVKGMLKMLKRLISEQIELNWKPEADMWFIKIDPVQVDQILVNLCINARDAIKDVGQITLKTHKIKVNENDCLSHPGLYPGDFVLLTVSDTGSGIEKGIINKIFEPFFTTKETGKGTGLGLATIYGIVKQNNGYIYVDSEVGKGSTFKIYLPKYSESEKVEKSDEKDIPVAFGRETILLVEDQKENLELTKKMLSGLGYQILSALTPKEAIKLAKGYSGKIDLLLTDVILPEMNGKVLAEKLVSAIPELKIIYMSGYSGEVFTDKDIMDKNMHFLQKPVSLHTLATEIRNTLEDTPSIEK